VLGQGTLPALGHSKILGPPLTLTQADSAPLCIRQLGAKELHLNGFPGKCFACQQCIPDGHFYSCARMRHKGQWQSTLVNLRDPATCQTTVKWTDGETHLHARMCMHLTCLARYPSAYQSTCTQLITTLLTLTHNCNDPSQPVPTQPSTAPAPLHT
jgi:hypothetical protein